MPSRRIPCRVASLVPLALVVAALLAPADARAIPAFARRYGVSCTLCHQPFPVLKGFGEEFAARGYAMPENAEPPGSTVDFGDSLLALPRDIPLSVRFDGFAALQNRKPQTDFEAPWAVKLLAGGRIADGVSFFGYYILEEGEPGTLEDLYLQFTDVFGLPVSVLAGQFQISDPIIKRELRLERLDYAILTTRVGASLVDLTYDRGVALMGDVGPARAVLSVTNGNGIGGPIDEAFDKDKYKNVSLHLLGDVGPLRVGAFGFWGKEAADAPGVGTNRTWYLGPQLSFALGELVQVSALYLERRDSNPTFTASHSEIATRGGFAEVVLHPGGSDGRFAVAALYNKVDSDLEASKAESFGLTSSWLFRRNVRLMAEVDRDVEASAWIGSVGAMAAF